MPPEIKQGDGLALYMLIFFCIYRDRPAPEKERKARVYTGKKTKK